ncbi:MAG: serpin family protein, partial [Phormidium sp.]
QWVSQRTENQINDLLGCPLGKNTKLVLTNAIYFKGNWQDKFDSKDTKEEPFTLASGKQEKVPLMYQSNHFSYGEAENLQVLEMPYKGNLSMVILLPAKPDGLPDLERNLTTANLENWLSLSPEKVEVWLPKLKFDQRFNLKGTLSQMGMADAFDEVGKADFSGIANQPNLYIKDVVHKAFVEVDESGTKAAAATAVIMCKGDCPATPATASIPKLFRADRPFLFLIKDQQSGSILFMGRFVNPNPDKQEEPPCEEDRN